jgi:hypothetical protein
MRFIKKVLFLIIVFLLLGGLYYALSYFTGVDPKGFSLPFFLKNLQFAVGDKVIPLGSGESVEPSKEVLAKFSVLTDSHNDLNYLSKALEKVKEVESDFVIHLGDWTQVGTQKELEESKEIIDKSGVVYQTVPGDHDLWASSGVANFEKIFGAPYGSFDERGVHVVLLNTSDTKLGLGEAQLNWLRKDLIGNEGKMIFAFMHLPLYHPTNNRTIWEKGGMNSEVKKEVDLVLELFSKYKVKGVFAGDHHFSSNFTEPVSGVKMYIVGAVTSSRNLQVPRFNLVTVYKGGDYKVEEIVIEE